MGFLYPLLLGGLVAAGAPVLLHLLLKQQPTRVRFPAFLFLTQNRKTNQQKLRLRNLLLLVARILLIALVCLALTRPTIFSARLNIVGDQPAAVVLIIDTSPSMAYRSGGKSSLELAVQKARELIDELPEGSSIAIVDSAEPGGTWFPSPTLATDYLKTLQIRPANGPMTSRLNEAYRLFNELEASEENKEGKLPRFLCLLTDRTVASWDATRQKELESLRDNLGQGVTSMLVDVGPEKPVDVAVLAVEQTSASLISQQRLQLQAAVRAAGADCDTELICKIDGESTGEHKAVRLKAGQSQVVTFERGRLTPGWHQATISLATNDSFIANDAVYATFEIKAGRRVLIVVDDARDADILKFALESTGEFQCDVRNANDAAGQRPQDLSVYRCICLLNVAGPPDLLWQLLEQFVKDGGGLAVMPGGTEIRTSAYTDLREANLLMPGKLVTVIKAPGNGASWKDIPSNHGLLAPFAEFSKQMRVDFSRFPPAAQRYWEVQPAETNSSVIVRYADDKTRPALLGRTFDAQLLRGKVVLFTTPMDTSHIDSADAWNDYVKTSFYLVLSSVSVGYLSGDAEERLLNFRSGQPVTVPVPANGRFATYLLDGPGLSKEQAVVRRPENKNEVVLTQAVTPGNYILRGGSQGDPAAYFSVNLPPEESQWDKAPTEQIEQVLGAGSVLAADRNVNLRETLQNQMSRPREMFLVLMILALFLLALENLLSNRFYDRTGANAMATGAKNAA